MVRQVFNREENRSKTGPMAQMLQVQSVQSKGRQSPSDRAVALMIIYEYNMTIWKEINVFNQGGQSSTSVIPWKLRNQSSVL